MPSSSVPFDIRHDDRDYSGTMITDRFLDHSDIEKSFFHGTVLNNCTFDDVKLNNTEFSESFGKSCHFNEIDLSGSDFVDCQFEDTEFSSCSFEKGEWRESVFKNCRFLGCDFTHTTIALCRFVQCEFDENTIRRLENRSIYTNVFQGSTFARMLTDQAFYSRNFGVPAADQPGTLVRTDVGMSIDQVCLLNNLGRLRTIDVVTVTENICNALAKGGHRRNSTLRFLCNIVRMMTEERRISATSLMYLEVVVMSLANTTEDQDVFKVVMDAIVEFRNALVLIAAEAQESAVQEFDGKVQSVSIFFPETHDRRQVELLKDALAETAGQTRDCFHIENVQYGSTLIEIVVSGTVTVAGLLTAFNYMLRQATITVQELGKFKKAVRSTFKSAKSTRTSQAITQKTSAKVPAIMKTGAVSETMKPLQTAVRRNGRDLAKMDGKAEVTVLIE
jgi:uncharacterized protein YjbI with pentapeptide repeats